MAEASAPNLIKLEKMIALHIAVTVRRIFSASPDTNSRAGICIFGKKPFLLLSGGQTGKSEQILMFFAPLPLCMRHSPKRYVIQL